jgi:hypothetical protein
MKSDSPTLEGFRLMVRQPLFGMAEIAWRWSLGTVFWLALAFSAGEYLKTLPVSNGELRLLRTRHPVLVADAIAHIFRGSSWRAAQSVIVLAGTLAIAWIVLSALARAAIIKSLLGYFRADAALPVEEPCRVPLHSLFGLSFLRVAVSVPAVIGFVGAFFFASAVSPSGNPAPGSAFLVFLSLVLFLWLAWSVLNWFLSLAAIFVVVEGQHTFQAIGSAVDLCRRRMGSVLAAGIWFGLGHIVAFVLATSLVAFPLGFAGIFPAGIVLGGVLLITLLYFAAADFLYVGRLAAYVAILELPETSAIVQPAPTKTPTLDQSGVVDQGELILSDVPAQA